MVLETILWVLGALTISYIAVRIWIALVDGVFAGLKRLNPFRKKKEPVNWHTLDGVEKRKETPIQKDSVISENERDFHG